MTTTAAPGRSGDGGGAGRRRATGSDGDRQLRRRAGRCAARRQQPPKPRAGDGGAKGHGKGHGKKNGATDSRRGVLHLARRQHRPQPLPQGARVGAGQDLADAVSISSICAGRRSALRRIFALIGSQMKLADSTPHSVATNAPATSGPSTAGSSRLFSTWTSPTTVPMMPIGRRVAAHLGEEAGGDQVVGAGAPRSRRSSTRAELLHRDGVDGQLQAAAQERVLDRRAPGSPAASMPSLRASVASSTSWAISDAGVRRPVGGEGQPEPGAELRRRSAIVEPAIGRAERARRRPGRAAAAGRWPAGWCPPAAS